MGDSYGIGPGGALLSWLRSLFSLRRPEGADGAANPRPKEAEMAVPPASDPYLLSRSTSDHAYAWVAAGGVAAIMAALIAGIALGFEAGDLFAQDAAARAADTEAQGTLAAAGFWNRALMLTGASLLMVSVVVVLQRIIATIRLRGTAMAATLPTLLAPEQRS